ncbi:CTP synthase (glutamine hydrolyzing) [Leptolyngbya sp. 15MV]|nr:CTP synthase (glutamine hydrolyzing) [Leptolyngbya sp. 15MV]
MPTPSATDWQPKAAADRPALPIDLETSIARPLPAPARASVDGPHGADADEHQEFVAGRTGRSSLLASAADRSADSEFYSPVPEGYRKGHHKYIFVLGTVMSGLGKGIFASSIAKMLKDKGLVVAPIKMEGYLNIDSGTLNPYRHGEVFVLDDGTECDMDLGTYERMLDQDLSRRNFTTSGQIFREVLDKEREGDYLGRDVQWIPHVTGEVKRKLRELATAGDGKRSADVVIVEVGGTVGDYENSFYIEALRELAFEEGPGSSAFVALTYIIEPNTLGEQKSKAAQLGIKRLMEAGIQPHLIACRATRPVGSGVRQKIAMFSNVPLRRVFSMHDRESIYTIPDEMRLEGLDREMLSILNLHDRVDAANEDRARERWSTFVRTLTAPRKHRVSLALAGKYAGLRDAYASIDKALEHVGAHLNTSIDISWIDTTELDQASVADVLRTAGPGGSPVDCVIVPGGFGKRGIEGKIAVARHCRETGLPYLGICLGFQVAVIEFARHVCGLQHASSTEFDTRELRTPQPVISELPDQKKVEGLGGTMRLGAQDVILKPGTLASLLYGKTVIRERFRHRYEVDPRYVSALEAGGMVFSGRHPKHPIMQVMELPAGEPGQGAAAHHRAAAPAAADAAPWRTGARPKGSRPRGTGHPPAPGRGRRRGDPIRTTSWRYRPATGPARCGPPARPNGRPRRYRRAAR